MTRHSPHRPFSGLGSYRRAVAVTVVLLLLPNDDGHRFADAAFSVPSPAVPPSRRPSMFYPPPSRFSRSNADSVTTACATTAPGTATAVLAPHPSGRRWKRRRKDQSFRTSPGRRVDADDEAALSDQLGYVPPNAVRVSARTRDGGARSDGGRGRPIAIKSYPLLVQLGSSPASNDGGGESRASMAAPISIDDAVTPFPTLYWLTCPRVSRAVSELERQGCVREFQARLEGDGDAARRLHESHEEYARERWDLLSEGDRGWILQLGDGGDDDRVGDGAGFADGESTVEGTRGGGASASLLEAERRKRSSMRRMIQCTGVAGTDHRFLKRETTGDDRNDDGDLPGACFPFVPSVKCLHSHYAHYISQVTARDGEKYNEGGASVALNPVGEWTHALLMEQFPDLSL